MIEDKNTGSPAEASRNALKYDRGELKVGESWTYHSVLTNKHGSEYGFIGKTVRLVETEVMEQNMKGVVVEVSGHAYYSEVNTYGIEKEDLVGQNGFLLEHLDRKGSN
ncbi:hypothetical protein Neosp_012570 [[Neocosmospora] mangrovei]